MCGIFGIVFADGITEPPEDKLVESSKLISHRGPDGHGIYSGPGVGFVHTRLSLVDLQQRSNQPMWDAEQNFCLIYNGEIYNFLELRHYLKGLGVEFATTSDTEVLLKLLIRDGIEAALPRLQGMFAFAFYDVKRKRIVLARDRFGIKPLHLYCDDNKIVFASEIKAMKPWVELKPNSFQMIRYLMNAGAPIRDKGFYENIDIVPAGSVVTITAGAPPEYSKFADVLDSVNRDKIEELEGLSNKQIIDLVDEQMQYAVKQMLFADAPVGALCSGGVDSSLIMAIASKYHNNLAIFHADVVGPLSEYDAAVNLAKHLNLDLLSVQTNDDDFIRLTPEVLFHYEQPFSGHPHSVPFMMVSKLVQENGVKAVLSGEGSDECFLGYEYIALEPFWRFFHRQIGKIRDLIERMPVIGHNVFNTESNFSQLVPDMLGQFANSIDQRNAREVYTTILKKPVDQNIRTLDLLRNHLVTLLHRNDTMGMSAGIEARFPFLDETFVETAVNLPLRHKIRFSPVTWEKDHPLLRDKWVIRQVADRYLPKLLSRRKKRGFNVNAFGRMGVHNRFFESDFINSQFKLSKNEAAYLFDTADQPLKLKLMMLEVWGRLFMQNSSVSEVQQDLRSCVSIKSIGQH